jgi:hypothetical protein
MVVLHLVDGGLARDRISTWRFAVNDAQRRPARAVRQNRRRI